MPGRAARALALFLLSRLQQPAPRVASAFPAMAEVRPYRQGFQRLSRLNGCFRFSVSRLQRPALWVISHSGYAAKDAASPDRLTPVRAEQALSLFYVGQTPAPSSLGHKPTQLRGKKRHTAVLSYARQRSAGCGSCKRCDRKSRL